jgi:hypothetical protein
VIYRAFPVAESFFATLKNELIYVHVWATRQSARTAIFAFIEGWYNRFRHELADLELATCQARPVQGAHQDRALPLP